MIRLTILYENSTTARFDFDYYIVTHLNLTMQRLQSFGFASWEVERCLHAMNGERPEFICITRLDFEDAEQMQSGFDVHGTELRNDFANYTNITPRIIVGEVAGHS